MICPFAPFLHRLLPLTRRPACLFLAAQSVAEGEVSICILELFLPIICTGNCNLATQEVL